MRKVSLISCIVLCVSLFSGTSFAAYLVDGPGTVKTTNILDGAVTTSKLASSAVTTAKLADGAVTTTKILDSAVTSTKIANGAVTDAKISGLISASKISSVGLNADTVDGKHASDLANAVHTHAQTDVTGLQAALSGKSDVTHNHDTLYQQKYGKVAVVAQTGGDYTDPVTAMNNVATWCGTPSAASPCLMKIMPGIYNVVTLEMHEYVDIEGSGELSTKILGSGNYPVSNNGAVNGASNAEIRSITIESMGVLELSVGMYNNTASPKITNVTIISKAEIGYFVNNSTGVLNSISSSPILTNVSVIASGGNSSNGIWNEWGSNPTLRNVTVSASTVGIYNLSSAPIIQDAIITAGMGISHVSSPSSAMSNVTINGSVMVYGNSTFKLDNSQIYGGMLYSRDTAKLYLGNSKFDGGVENSTGTFACVGVYNGNYQPLGTNCQ